MTTGKPTKKIYLINRDFQLRYARTAVAVGFFSTLLTVVLILFPLFQFQILRFPNFVPMPFVLGMVMAAVINFVMVAYFGILMTHRIAGPMFSLVRQFRLVSGGNYNAAFGVRERDELKFVIRNFNEMVAGLTSQTLKDVEKIDRIVMALSENPSQPALEDAKALRAELMARIKGNP
jgi:methyl-accepting chemotaxis protein